MEIQIKNLEHIYQGKILQTNHGILSFVWFGNYYTTNHNRKTIYSYDDKSWRPAKIQGFFRKWGLVRSGKARKQHQKEEV